MAPLVFNNSGIQTTHVINITVVVGILFTTVIKFIFYFCFSSIIKYAKFDFSVRNNIIIVVEPR